jgi:hypothetical protein
MLSASIGISLTGQGWISVREGKSKREMEITEPINVAIARIGKDTGWVFASEKNSLTRFITALSSTLLRSDTFVFFYRYASNVRDVAHQLRDKFGFEKSFIKWFLASSLSHYILHRRALDIVEKNRNRIKGLVVYMEYHALTGAMIHAAKKYNIPVVLTQHGFIGQEWLHFPVQSDRICVWGEVDRDWYKERGIGEDRVRITGTHLAFDIKSEDRRRMRGQFKIEPGQYVIFYLIPNTLDYFHERSVKLLDQLQKSLSGVNCRWFIRPHRNNKSHVINMYTALGFESFPGDVPVDEAFALADVIIHDYSTLATAEYSGLVTLCLPADPPYPEFYIKLLGEQRIISNPEQFTKIVKGIKPGYEPKSKATPAMAAGGEEALRNICRVVEELRV